jgi:hypothetical protein
MENGMFQGGNGSNTNNAGNKSMYVTAMLKNNGQTTYAIKGGDSQSGGLSTWYSGPLPTTPGYAPMHQEGGIILGIGGDNSNANVGTFFEGVMTAGYPSDAADNAVQANIVSVGYTGATNVRNSPAGSTITDPVGKCVDVNGDDTGTDGTPVQLWDCQSWAQDQHWTRQADNSLTTIGRCMDVTGGQVTAGTPVQLYSCNGTGAQVWVPQSDGSLLNPQSGMCLDATNGSTANGTRLQIWTCNNTQAQKFTINPAVPPTDLALNRPTTASSQSGTAFLATDGDVTTRWGSDYSDPQWLQVDLGAIHTINEVKLVWEAAYGKAFQIQVSTDGSNWTTIYSTTTGAGGRQDLTGLNGTGRYIRMYGTVRGTGYGYSLWSFNVYGN